MKKKSIESGFENPTIKKKKEKIDLTIERLEPREILRLVKKHEASGVDNGEIDRTKGIDTEMQLTEPMTKILENIIILDGGLWEFRPEQIDVVTVNIDTLRSDIGKMGDKNKDEKSRAEAFLTFFDNPGQITKAQKKAEVLAD